jgi:micrococcal nuclease
MKGIKVGNKLIPYWALWLILFIIIFPFKDSSLKNNIVVKNDIVESANFNTIEKDITKNNNYKFFVKRVIDGDTIELDNGEIIRYIGINTPETVRPKYPVECFGREASEKNKELVLGKKVILKKDISQRDKYGRLLRYVYVSGIFVNLKLIEGGYAYATAFPPDVKYSDVFLNAQRDAIENNFGLWGSCKKIKDLSSVKDNSEKNIRICEIKGNISKRGEKIYHSKECEYYNKTKITESKGERWFCSEKEALNAGWRKALNCSG